MKVLKDAGERMLASSYAFKAVTVNFEGTLIKAPKGLSLEDQLMYLSGVESEIIRQGGYCNLVVQTKKRRR